METLNEGQAVARALIVVRETWHAYKSIRDGVVVYCGDKEMYESVRKRLNKMFMGDKEKLSRFRYLNGA